MLFQGDARNALAVPNVDGLSYHEAKRRVLEEFQRTMLTRAVEQAGGSVTAAARALGLRKTSLYRMLKDIE